MFSKPILETFLMWDIESTTTTKTYQELPEPMQHLWEERCDYLRAQKLPPLPEGKTEWSNDDLWPMKGPLQAEFGRVVCISFGRFSLETPSEPILKVKSLFGTDENNILARFSEGLEKTYHLKSNTKMVGHNIKRFDVPFVSKRMVINGIDLPIPMRQWDKKPWEMSFLDTTDVWGFGAWQEGFTSLKLMSTVLGLPSPKDDISGADVYGVYWNEENGVERIKTYCEKDVAAQARLMLRLANYSKAIIDSLIIQ